MARIRSVHPGLFTDEAFVTCSPLARLLVVGLWTECDDQGIFEWKPVTLKMRLLPVDNVDVAGLLAELAANNLICGFSHGGKEYGAVRNFRKFQRPKKPTSQHFMPPEFRTYVALDSVSSEHDDAEDHPSSEPKPTKRASVPQKGEIAPQMEDGGKEKGEKASPLVQQPTTTAAPAAAEKPLSVSEAVAQAMARRGQPSPLHDLARLCHEALGLRGQVPHGLQHMGPIEDLIEAKWSLERHILPALRDAAQKGRTGKTWAYYVKIITDGVSEPPKLPSPPPAEPATETFLQRRQREWRQQLAAWKQYGTWSDQWGSAPGSSSCQIPPEFVAEFERQHANGAAA